MVYLWIVDDVVIAAVQLRQHRLAYPLERFGVDPWSVK